MRRTITPEQESQLREILARPGHPPQRELAEQYGVSQSTISRIAKDVKPHSMTINEQLKHSHVNLVGRLDQVYEREQGPVITQEYRERESKALREAMCAVGPNPDDAEWTEEPEEDMEVWDAVLLEYKDHPLVKEEERPLMQRAICIAVSVIGRELFGQSAAATKYVEAIYDDLLITEEEANDSNLEPSAE